MKTFMGNDVLLSTQTAQRLYFEHAAKLPVLDYRTHLSTEQIAGKESFRSPARLLLADPVKWRLMRAGGIEEKYITGDASDKEKFLRFAQILPQAVGSPVYVRTHLELKRFFGCDRTLEEKTAEAVWEACSDKMKQPELTADGILKQANIETVGTLADAADDLKYYRQIEEDETRKGTVLPVFCPDKALAIDAPEWENYMKYELGMSADIDISTMQDIRDVLAKRLDYFASLGCRTADHTLEHIACQPAEEFELDDIVGKTINGKGGPAAPAREKYQTALLLFLAREYARRGWIMQLEYGVSRDNNSRMSGRLGSNKGYDCLTTSSDGRQLARLLDALVREDMLPRMIITSRNPADQAMIASVLGAFQEAGIAGKLQLGGSWTFQGDKSGIKNQLATVAGLSLLGTAVNMASNAYSFLACARHEYYRRVLCDFLGKLVERGEYPADWEKLGQLTENICYYNAKKYFAG